MLLLDIPTAYFTGMVTGASLIAAIGAQNAFVLSQGVRREYHWQIGLTCSLIDTLLIFAGVMGMGALISASPVFLSIATWGGAAFLILYGLKALLAALKNSSLEAKGGGFKTLKSAVLATMALSLLNPHVYLDTVVLLGSLGGRYPGDESYWFAAGASSFSIIWFFSISFGARALTPLFKNPDAWRILDLLVCITMWSIAAMLISDALAH